MIPQVFIDSIMGTDKIRETASVLYRTSSAKHYADLARSYKDQWKEEANILFRLEMLSIRSRSA